MIDPPILSSLLRGKASKDLQRGDRWLGREGISRVSRRFSFMRPDSISCRSSIPLDCYNRKLERVRGDAGWQIQNERAQATPRHARVHALSTALMHGSRLVGADGSKRPG